MNEQTRDLCVIGFVCGISILKSPILAGTTDFACQLAVCWVEKLFALWLLSCMHIWPSVAAVAVVVVFLQLQMKLSKQLRVRLYVVYTGTEPKLVKKKIENKKHQ